MNYANTPLVLGASGRPVTFLQSRLGATVSGVFDAVTHEALQRWQSAAGLVADGVYGPLTNAALTTLSADAVNTVAGTLAIDPKALQALLTVETVGHGFYANGLPKILLERHYVYRLATPAQRAELTADICNPTPGGYVGGLGEWSRFDRVAAVDINLAVRSCSWGIAQIMGDNAATFLLTPAAFALQMARDEDTQVMLLGEFITHNDELHDALTLLDWDNVAKLYNGANYAANNYNGKLAAAYAAA